MTLRITDQAFATVRHPRVETVADLQLALVGGGGSTDMLPLYEQEWQINLSPGWPFGIR